MSHIDIAPETFDTDVIRASYDRLVVVDFWAPWCGPCRSLGPTLERLAAQAQGAWSLAKIDTQQHPSLGQRFAVRSIPAVKAFRNGQIVGEFTGNRPAGFILEWLASLGPQPADDDHARAVAHRDRGEHEAALLCFEAALDADPSHLPSKLGRIGALTATGRAQDALDAVDALAEAERRAESQAVARLGLEARSRLAPSMEALLERIADGADTTTQLELGYAYARDEDWDKALETWFALAYRAKGAEKQQARAAMLQAFAALGRTPLVVRYQRQLTMAMF